jgi:hypothetical protein
MRLKRKYVGSTKLGSCSGVEVLVGVLCQSFRMLKKRLLGALPTHPTTHTRPLARMQHGPPRLSSHCAAACDGRACGVHRKSRMAHESLSYALTRVSVRACTHGRATSCASDAAACSAGGGLSRRRRARRRAALMELKRRDAPATSGKIYAGSRRGRDVPEQGANSAPTPAFTATGLRRR